MVGIAILQFGKKGEVIQGVGDQILAATVEQVGDLQKFLKLLVGQLRDTDLSNSDCRCLFFRQNRQGVPCLSQNTPLRLV